MHLKDLFVFVVTALGGTPLGYDPGVSPPSNEHYVNLSQPDQAAHKTDPKNPTDPKDSKDLFGANNPRNPYGFDPTKDGNDARDPYDPYDSDSTKNGQDAHNPFSPFGTETSTDANDDNNPDGTKSSSDKTELSDLADSYTLNSSTKPYAPNDPHNLYHLESAEADGAGDGFGPFAAPYDTSAVYGKKSDAPVKFYGPARVLGVGSEVSSVGAALGPKPYAPNSNPYVERTERFYGEYVVRSPKPGAGFDQKLGDSLYDPLAAPKSGQSLGGGSTDPYSLSAVPSPKSKSWDLGGDPRAMGLNPLDPRAGLTSAPVFGAASHAPSQSPGLGASLSALSPTTSVSGDALNNHPGSMGPLSPDLGQEPRGGALQ
jgi:hypothetical protein